MTPQLGFAFVPMFGPDRLLPLARAVDASGLDELWVWEDCFKESAIAASGLALGATERIRVGIGLMPVPLRNVALAAMELATLSGAAPGRLIAGIGHGVQDWMAQAGVRADAPLTLLREHAVALRALLDGEEVTSTGRYVALDRVKLDWPPAERVPLMIGGGRPRTLRTAGELGDGVLLAGGATDDELRDAIGSAKETGGDALPVVASLIVAMGDEAEERARRELAVWAPDAGAGDDSVSSDPRAAGRGAVGGDAAAIAARVQDYADLGVTTVVFQPTADEPDLEGLAARLGSEVAPLIRG